MAGYTRQSLADIQDGEDIVAAPLNAEFDQLQDAFNAITGHTHDGTIGNGPKININDSTTGTINDDRLPSSMTGKTFTSDVTIAGSGNTNLFIKGAGVNTIELGRVDGTPSNSGIDFHSSGNNIDYDSRIVANGGTGVAGNGSLNYVAAAHTFTGSTYMNTLGKSVDTSLLLITGGITGGANIELYGPTHATDPNKMMLDANTISMRNANGSGTPTVTIGGNTVWHAGNMGPGSGLNADLLDGNSSLFYQDASNINAGTLNEARLPSTINGAKTFTGAVQVSSLLTSAPNQGIELGPANIVNTPFIDFHSDGQGTDYSARILASGGGAGAGQGSLSITAGGGLNLLSTNLFGVGATFSNTVNGVNFVATDAFYVRNDSDRYIRFQTAGGVNRGTVVHNNAGGSMQIFTYNASGVFQHSATFNQDGGEYWSGHFMRIGGAAASSEYQLTTNLTAHSYRMIGDNGGGLFIQRSNDRFVANASNLLYFNSANGAIFASHVYGVTFQANSSGNGTAFKVGDDAWIGDIDVGNTMSVRGQQDFNSGFIRFGAGQYNLGVFSSATDRLYYGNSFYMQADGNMYLPIYGDTLYNVVNRKLEVSQSSDVNELNFPIGHSILCTGGTTNRNQTATPYNRAAANQYTTSPVGSALAGTWRARGQDTDTWILLQRVG